MSIANRRHPLESIHSVHAVWHHIYLRVVRMCIRTFLYIYYQRNVESMVEENHPFLDSELQMVNLERGPTGGDIAPS